VNHRRHTDLLRHINHDHSDDLLVAARAFAGHPDATAARAERIDPHGIDLVVQTPSGPATARVDFAEPIPDADYPDGVRVAFVRLVRRARTALSGSDGDAAVH
jgi:putative heme iron utilization protein